jgi:hypothetical protein
VTAVDIDDGALPARLWNGAELHVVSGTRLLRCWFTCSQLDGCLDPSKTRTRSASRISFSLIERRTSARSRNHAMQPQMDTDKHR